MQVETVYLVINLIQEQVAVVEQLQPELPVEIIPVDVVEQEHQTLSQALTYLTQVVVVAVEVTLELLLAVLAVAQQVKLWDHQQLETLEQLILEEAVEVLDLQAQE
jgi:hypothetical protein